MKKKTSLLHILIVWTSIILTCFCEPDAQAQKTREFQTQEAQTAFLNEGNFSSGLTFFHFHHSLNLKEFRKIQEVTMSQFWFFRKDLTSSQAYKQNLLDFRSQLDQVRDIFERASDRLTTIFSWFGLRSIKKGGPLPGEPYYAHQTQDGLEVQQAVPFYDNTTPPSKPPRTFYSSTEPPTRPTPAPRLSTPSSTTQNDEVKLPDLIQASPFTMPIDPKFNQKKTFIYQKMLEEKVPISLECVRTCTLIATPSQAGNGFSQSSNCPFNYFQQQLIKNRLFQIQSDWHSWKVFYDERKIPSGKMIRNKCYNVTPIAQQDADGPEESPFGLPKADFKQTEPFKGLITHSVDIPEENQRFCTQIARLYSNDTKDGYFVDTDCEIPMSIMVSNKGFYRFQVDWNHWRIYYDKTRKFISPHLDFITQLDQLSPKNRPKRMLGVIGALFSFGLSAYNYYQISQLKAQVDTLKANQQISHANQEMLLMSVRESHKAVETLTKNMEEVKANLIDGLHTLDTATIILKTQQEINRVWNIAMAYEDEIKSLQHTAQELLTGRFDADALDTSLLTEHWTKMLGIAKRQGYELLSDQISELFRSETSYIVDLENESVEIFVHLPIRQTTPMTLYRYLPHGHRIDNDRSIQLIDPRGGQFIAADPKTMKGVILKKEDLQNCRIIRNNYLCPKHGLMRRKIQETCLGALLFNDYEQAQNKCLVQAIANEEETLQKTASSQVALTVHTNKTIRFICGNQNEVHRVNIQSKTYLIDVPADCILQTEQYEFLPDENLIYQASELIHVHDASKLLQEVHSGLDLGIDKIIKVLEEVKDYQPRPLSELQALHEINTSWQAPGMFSVGAIMLTIVIIIATAFCMFKRHQRGQPLFPCSKLDCCCGENRNQDYSLDDRNLDNGRMEETVNVRLSQPCQNRYCINPAHYQHDPELNPRGDWQASLTHTSLASIVTPPGERRLSGTRPKTRNVRFNPDQSGRSDSSAAGAASINDGTPPGMDITYDSQEGEDQFRPSKTSTMKKTNDSDEEDFGHKKK